MVARRRTLLGAIELSSAPIADPPVEAVTTAIREALEVEGIDLLTWSESATSLRARLDFLHRAIGDPWPDVSDVALTRDLESWLGTQLARVRSAQDLRRIDVPVLVAHGDDDQIVPIGASALMSSKLLGNATLKVYQGGDHGYAQTHQDAFNADLLAFIQRGEAKAAA